MEVKEKVIIVSYYTQTLDLVQMLVDEMQMKFVRLGKPRREALLRNFWHGDCWLLLAFAFSSSSEKSLQNSNLTPPNTAAG